jgi:hypothetical protein
MRINDAAVRLSELATEGLVQMADPLLPDPQPSDLDDATRRTILQTYLETRLERQAAVQEQVVTLLTETDPATAAWSNVQRIAVLTRQIALGVCVHLEDCDPATLTSVLSDYIRHEFAPRQAVVPRRWWRLPWQRWLQAAGDLRWHVRIAHTVALALSRIDAYVWQDTQTLSAALDEALRDALARARVPDRDRYIFTAALLGQALPLRQMASAISLPAQSVDGALAQASASDESFRVTRQQGGLKLAVATGSQREFLLTVPVPEAPALAALSGHESLFSDHLPEVVQTPMVSVTLREQEDKRYSLLAGVRDTFRSVRWQVEVLIDEQVVASASTNEVGIAQIRDLPGSLVQHQLTLHCTELPFPE